ncbi:peptide chain release factor 1 [Finegoldia magna]|uniref:Peptide chain release factor 1 n=4 Tax=Finegoldia TaxID=150022 RepID=RF1_FINM2|nr:peptide chain release factor 1 [Finegoldia magna]B0S2B6.1 RecName: Full=Peptide chain release factor 1; Short=RF-1 [Finegoldia magna ATCC 29328]EFL53658.1 peptide chain release factor 1 [Finegoldia magna BVS033A4]EGS32616.1 peptide chain release factor 1 [Finegoldia magna SY403409CC001050417]EXF26719.1 peptide chain release factor 1 [Finegoldia magna ALB8]KXA07783.1 peptide chain release factor 1 [Finegoldia magna]MBS6927787.1 peptide chain release factor 1 [Finegoldia magna]
MFENLDSVVDKFKDLEVKVADPEVIADMENWTKLMKEHADLEPVVNKYLSYKDNLKNLEEDKELLGTTGDSEMEELLKDEISTLEEQIEKDQEELKILLLPKDPNDEKNVFIEIRAGAGGDEAGLFAGELLRMYQMYSDKKHWTTEIMDIQQQGVGGIKEVVMMVKGKGAYSRLKYESGVHRVQRVPQTESSGRIHTSTATVAVLPEAEDVDVKIEQKDLRIDVFRASGNGGQCVNTTDSAVRITHIPTGLVVTCQDEKSQIKNKDKAMKVLKSRLYDLMEEEKNKDRADARKSQVGTGDRSERIRTYNFPQGRITDHRINKTIFQLQNFLDGDIEEMIDDLTSYDQAEKLKMMN